MRDYKRKFEDDCKGSKESKQWLFTEINRELQVSTCYRQSSSICPSWFYETFIWQVGKDRERELIGDATGTRLSHFQVCEWIIKNEGWNQDKFYEELEND